MYIEISGRTSGKSYRAGVDIVKWIQGSLRNIAVLKAPSKRQAMIMQSYALDVCPRLDTSRIFYYADYKEKEEELKNFQTKFYFDEFDFDGNLNEDFIFENGYYVTTPKLRNSDDFKKGDFLYDLLKFNDFLYTKREHMVDEGFLPREFFKKERERMGEGTFQAEYEARFLNYE